MMNEIVKFDKDQSAEYDGWDLAAQDAADRVVRGTRLTFADWKWSARDEDVAVGTQLVALNTACAWVRWVVGKRPEYRMRRPGERLPERDELGDLDQNYWDLAPDGTRKDPWQFTRFVYLMDPSTAEIFTFTTSSFGGREAVLQLAEQVAVVRRARPGAMPVVALGSADMPTKFGRKSRPVFRVLSWVDGAGQNVSAPSLQEAPRDQIEFAPATAEPAEEEIPF